MDIGCVPGKQLSVAEKSVIDFINDQPRFAALLSISDIAKGAFVSNSTVSRAIRKCGFSSLSEMKFCLSHEPGNTIQAHKINHILSKSYVECLETIKSIHIDSIVEIVRLLRNAKVVYILAGGLTVMVANEFAFQLQCQRINACVISDLEMMRHMDILATENDLVIVISVKNARAEFAVGAQLAKHNGAQIVTFTCTKGTPLDTLADIAVYGYTQSIAPNQAFGGISRLGLFIITRTIIEYFVTITE